MSGETAAAIGRDLYDLLNRTEYNGGGPLFGVKGNVVVGHGRSSAAGIARAVNTAARLCDTGLTGKMEEELNALRSRTAS